MNTSSNLRNMHRTASKPASWHGSSKKPDPIARASGRRWAFVWATSLAVALVTGHSNAVRAAPPNAQFGQHRVSPSFDLRDAIIPTKEIRAGGPPKDGIPALTSPAVIRAQDAAYLNAADRVAGVAVG